MNPEKRIARIFEDVGGFYYCDDSLPHLDVRGGVHKTVRDVLHSIRSNNCFNPSPFTHYVRGNVTRRVRA